jgi:predicted DNA-binding transcriptional regulator YafY
MPSNKTHNTLARQWELLKLLPTRGPGKTAKELAEALDDAGFKISKRQVERDLGNLYDAFKLDCNNASIPYGWRLPPHAQIDLPGITLAEALSLRLVEDTLKVLMPSAMMRGLEPRFHHAKRKLETLVDENPAAQWINKVAVVPQSLPLLPPPIDHNVLETVQEALLADRQLDIEYHKFDAEQTSKQTLHPLGLVQRGPVTYLVATAFMYTDIHLYVLHRIISATKTEKHAVIPEGFNLDNYIASGALQFGMNGSICLNAQIEEGLAYILGETPLAADQHIEEKDGIINLSATVTDSWQLRWWILSQGASIKIVEPVALRQEIADTLQLAGGQYL